MALTKNDLAAVRSIVRDETLQFVTKSEVAGLVTKEDLAETEKRLRSDFASKEDLVSVKAEVASVRTELGAVEGRLTKRIEAEAEKLAQITIKEFRRVHRRTEALARHVGYTFEPEADEGA
jgi:hypothetical protein